VTHQVLHGNVVSAAEAVAIIVACRSIDWGMTVFVTVLNVRPAMTIKILARTFNTIVKTFALHIAKL
jgi:hypothetical protein